MPAPDPPLSTEDRPQHLREVSVELPVAPEAAWIVVSDPTTYPRWLVGAVDILDVDDEWPAQGSAFRHRVGLAGPVTTKDCTSSEGAKPPHRLDLEARAWPFGRAHVEIEVRAADDGCEVAMREGMLSPLKALSPVAQPLIAMRNRESLRRLSRLPELGG